MSIPFMCVTENHGQSQCSKLSWCLVSAVPEPSVLHLVSDTPRLLPVAQILTLFMDATTK